MFRIRARSFATIGKTIGKANTPSSNNRSLNRFAIVESPSMTGVIGVALRPMSNPIETSRFLKYFVFDHSFFTCRGSVSRTSIAAVQAAATAGGWEPLSSHVLETEPRHVKKLWSNTKYF